MTGFYAENRSSPLEVYLNLTVEYSALVTAGNKISLLFAPEGRSILTLHIRTRRADLFDCVTWATFQTSALFCLHSAAGFGEGNNRHIYECQ